MKLVSDLFWSFESELSCLAGVDQNARTVAAAILALAAVVETTKAKPNAEDAGRDGGGA